MNNGNPNLVEKPQDPERPLLSMRHLYLSIPSNNSRFRREGLRTLICLGVLLLSYLMPQLKDKGLWVSYPCPFKLVTGIQCPTCGLTRSFSLIANGKLRNAFDVHRLGPFLFLILLVRLSFYLSSLLAGVRIRFRTSPNERRALLFLSGGTLTSCWIYDLVSGKTTRPQDLL